MKIHPFLTAALLSSCGAISASDFTEDEAGRYLAVVQEEQAVEAELSMPSLEPEKKVELEQRRQALQESLGTIEEAVEDRKHSGVIGGLLGLLGPYGALLTPLLVPLAGSRGRKKAVEMLKALNPFDSSRPATSLPSDLAQLVGASHSRPEPKA